MRLVKIVMLGASALVALALVLGLFLRSRWNVERSITIDADAARVEPWIADLARWPEWMPWSKERDPTAEFDVRGRGVGAELAWSGKRLGRNRVTLTAITPARGVEYEIRLAGSEHPGRGSLRLESAGSAAKPATKVEWHETGDVGWNPIYHMLVPPLERALERDFALGLERLKQRAESGG